MMVIRRKQDNTTIQKKDVTERICDAQLAEVMSVGEQQMVKRTVFDIMDTATMSKLASVTSIDAVIGYIGTYADELRESLKTMMVAVEDNEGKIEYQDGKLVNGKYLTLDEYIERERANGSTIALGKYTVFVSERMVADDDLTTVMRITHTPAIMKEHGKSSVSLYNLDGSLYKTYYDISDIATEFCTTIDAVVKSLNRGGLYRGYMIAKGYVKNIKPYGGNLKTKPIYFLDDDNNVTHEFSTTKEAAEFLGVKPDTVLRALSRGNKCQGYILTRTKPE